MKEISLTINGQKFSGKEGDTVLQICQANGIDVPTLCHMEGLSDVGACRLCVVEIEKERRPVPSCTYPARDGLVVRTDTEKLEKYRRQILELIFTERNHFCMFCQQSGDCELQNLAYRYQMDHVRYPYAFPAMRVDALNENLVIDHNRCILCGRCVRACSEVVGVHTLDFSKRGWKTTISADLEESLGESSCISCGACMQFCPTGAIYSKLSLYKGKDKDCQQAVTACPICGVGCELKVFSRDNNLVRIDSTELTGPRAGLCQKGRFGLLRDGRARITSPMLRGQNGKLKECSLDEAVSFAAAKLARLNGGFAGIASSRYPSETLEMFRDFIQKVMSSRNLDTLDGPYYRLIAAGLSQFNGRGLGIECAIEEILNADCIFVVGADPLKENPIVGSLVLRALHQKNARIIVLNANRDVFSLWSEQYLRPAAGSEGLLLEGIAQLVAQLGLARDPKVAGPASGDITAISRTTGIPADAIESAARSYARAERAVIIYGKELLNGNAAPIVSLVKLARLTGNWAEDKLRIISLKPGANSRGAWELGLASVGIARDGLKGAYVVLADETENCQELANQFKKLDLLMVQATYQSPLTALAQVVFPSPDWAVREGTYVGLDGRRTKAAPVLKLREGMARDQEILAKLAAKMGRSLN